MPKEPISIRLDAHVLEWFRVRYPKYQTEINQLLREHMEKVIRDEEEYAR